MKRIPKGELHIFGIGPKGPAQLTLEAVEGIKTCAEVYGAVFFDEMTAFCAQLGVKFRPLSWGGKKAQPHRATLPGKGDSHAIEEKIIRRLSRGVRVGLLVDGHPALFSFAAPLVVKARNAGHPCREYASISSLDQILATLPRLPGAIPDAGMAVYNALSPGLRRMPFRTDLPAFFYNIGHLFKSGSHFDALVSQLSNIYGSRKKVYLIECVPHGENVRPCSMSGIPGELPLIGVNATLVVPAEIGPNDAR